MRKELPQSVPKERLSHIFLGLGVHVVPIIVFILLVSLFDFSFLAIGAAFSLVSFFTLCSIRLMERKSPAVKLPALSTYDFLKGILFILITAGVCGTLFIITGYGLLSYFIISPWSHSPWSAIFLAVLLTDLCYYWLHRSLSHSKKKNKISHWCRKNHDLAFAKHSSC